MATLHIEHPISDFETWAVAFDRFSDARQSAGVRAQRILRPVDDPHYVMVDLDFDTVEAAGRFRHFLETVVWSSPDNAPALVATPRAMVLELVPG